MHESSTSIPMNYVAYLKAFAWLSIIGLSCALFSTFWMPMLIGAVGITLLIRLAR